MMQYFNDKVYLLIRRQVFYIILNLVIFLHCEKLLYIIP